MRPTMLALGLWGAREQGKGELGMTKHLLFTPGKPMYHELEAEVERLKVEYREARELLLRAYYDLHPIRGGNDTKQRINLYIARTREAQATLEDK